MADVIAHFLKPLPWRVQLKGEWWRVEVCQQNKSGKQVAITAWADDASGRSYHLWASHKGMLYGALVDGIHVKGGTPQRGLVTELRRAGLMLLKPVPPKNRNGSFLEEVPEWCRPPRDTSAQR